MYWFPIKVSYKYVGELTILILITIDRSATSGSCVWSWWRHQVSLKLSLIYRPTNTVKIRQCHGCYSYLHCDNYSGRHGLYFVLDSHVCMRHHLDIIRQGKLTSPVNCLLKYQICQKFLQRGSVVLSGSIINITAAI